MMMEPGLSDECCFYDSALNNTMNILKMRKGVR